jgi:hypothetical protein
VKNDVLLDCEQSLWTNKAGLTDFAALQSLLSNGTRKNPSVRPVI